MERGHVSSTLYLPISPNNALTVGNEPQLISSQPFLPREAMLSAVFAVVVCLCVCVCVCVCVRHTPVLYQNG